MVSYILTDFRASVTSSCDKNQSDGVSSRSHMEIKVIYRQGEKKIWEKYRWVGDGEG